MKRKTGLQNWTIFLQLGLNRESVLHQSVAFLYAQVLRHMLWNCFFRNICEDTQALESKE